jgi:hypothetical protein
VQGRGAEATADTDSQNARQSVCPASFRLGCPPDRVRLRHMLLLAATTLEKLQAVPARFWMNVALAIGVGLVIIILIRYASRMNKLVLSLVIFIMVAVVGVHWVYERNEPKFLTPTVNKIAPYLPKKPQYREYEQPR